MAVQIIAELANTISRRAEMGGSGSYTRQLLDGGVNYYGAKVLEEAEELVRAASLQGRKRTIEEAADLLYHLLVLLRGESIELSEVADELIRRRR